MTNTLVNAPCYYKGQKAADLVLFDPATVAAKVPEYAYDFPRQGRRLIARSEGVMATQVASTARVLPKLRHHLAREQLHGSQHVRMLHLAKGHVSPEILDMVVLLEPAEALHQLFRGAEVGRGL